MTSNPITLSTPTNTSAYRAAFSDLQLLAAPSEPHHRIIRATVYDVSTPAENLQRIVIHSPELVGFQLSGPDEFFGLFMPPNTHEDLHLPFYSGETNIRACVPGATLATPATVATLATPATVATLATLATLALSAEMLALLQIVAPRVGKAALRKARCRKSCKTKIGPNSAKL